MNTEHLTDYYPVYRDLADRMNEHSAPVSGPDPSTSPAMLNAEELTSLALKYELSPFQTVLMLLKNAFEGHVFLTWQLRPEELSSRGTILFRAKPEFMLLNFYKDFEKYKPGLAQIWKTLQLKVPGLEGINFDAVLLNLFENHLIRLPVSLLSHYDIHSSGEKMLTSKQALDQHFELLLLAESSLGEYEFVQRINRIYKEKFKESVHQLAIREEVFMHYQRKLELCLCSDINTEEDLDELMYKKLIEEEIIKNVRRVIKPPDSRDNSDSDMLSFAHRTKILYRAVSKNCSEIHKTTDGEVCFPELNDIFLRAHSIYNEEITALPASLLQYMKMLLLLSQVVILRKNRGLAISDKLQLLSNFNGKELFLKDELKSLKKDLDSNLMDFRIKSYTDYKIKFVMDDDFTDMHKHFLQKQMEFIDQQIIQVQSDIREVMKMKSDSAISDQNENQ